MKNYIEIFVPRKSLHEFGEYLKETGMKHGPYNVVWGGYMVPVEPSPALTFWQLMSNRQ